LDLFDDKYKWQAALRSVDCVVHLAARVHQFGLEGQDASTLHETNVVGSRILAEEAARAGVKRFVFLSSIKVNGEGGEGVRYSASDSARPEDAYGKSKLAAEMIISDVCIANQVEYVCLRPPLVYGPGVKGNFFRLMRLTDLGVPLPFRSIDNLRSFISLENLLSFIETCIVHPKAANNTWLISDGEDLSTPDLLMRLARHMSRQLLLFPFPPRWLCQLAGLVGKRPEMERLSKSLRVNIDPAVQILGWHPPISVDEGLARATVDYCIRRNTNKNS
jgi:nucleoside-diphosphate-sugar epimerase